MTGESNRWRLLVAAAFSVPIFLMIACGGGGSAGGPSAPNPNPVPAITSLTPSSAAAGSAAQALNINGTNFLSNSTVTFNRIPHTATFVSSAQLTIQLTASDQMTAGTYPVVVTNPVPGGGASNTFNFTVNESPAITSANHTTFTVGMSGSFTVTATGSPAPTLSESGALPSGVTFNAATGVLSGTPATGTAGTYNLTFTASNGVTPNATQSFTLTVNPPTAIAFTSASSATFAVGVPGSFTVTATGSPAPTLSESGGLPSGVTFNAATGVLSGTAATGTSGTYNITFTASNGVASNATQSFTLTVNQSPAITSANHVTFTAGVAGSFTVTATGLPAPTLSESGALPSGVTFNAATGVLSGSAAAGTGGTYSITFTASNGVSPNATQSFALTVNNPVPHIMSISPTSAVAGATAQTLTINGTNFLSSSTVTFNGVSHAVTFASASQLTIQLTAGDQATAGTYPVVVSNPAPGGGGSNTAVFTVMNPNPIISLSTTALNFGSVPVGTAAELEVTVMNTGTGTLTGSATTSAPFSISSAASTYSITAGGSVTLLARFQPSATGAMTGTLSCTGGGGATVSLSGIGGSANTFNFQRELFGTPPTLTLNLLSVDPSTGNISLGGGDSAQPTMPFTFDWGDGTSTSGFFNQSHTYADVTKNHVISVTAHYSSTSSDTQTITVWFVAPALQKTSYPSGLSVTVPNQATTLTSTCCYTAPTISFFDDTFFSATRQRPDLEYVLSQVASIDFNLANQDEEQVNGGFQQVILRDPTNPGSSALWYTAPIAVAAGNTYITGTDFGYSSLFHEMGHNFTLNTPSTYRYGGKIDGNANAIYSETMAQIFQHTAAYQLINNAQAYGLTPDVVNDIAASASSSMWVVRTNYDNYVSAGMPFASWNDPNTPQDETLGTFMTLAYTFFKHAENDGLGYQLPLMRMMRLLQTFNPSLAQQYDPNNNTAAADTFRSTLMVAAMSYGFGTDLRAEFRSLNFPVDDTIYSQLMASVP